MFDQKKLSLFYNTLLRLYKTRECLQHNQQSPSFLKSMVLGEMRGLLEEKKEQRQPLGLNVYFIPYPLQQKFRLLIGIA